MLSDVPGSQARGRSQPVSAIRLDRERLLAAEGAFVRWSDHVHLTPDRPFSSEVDTGCGSGMASASVGRYLREGDRPMRRQLDRIDDDRDHACGAGKEEAPVRRGMNSPSHLPPPTAISPARDRLLVSLKCNSRFSIETNDSGTTTPGSGVHVRLSPSLPPSLSVAVG